MDTSKINDKIEILTPPQKVDMADDWYQFASLEHFWIKSRFRAIESKLAKEETGPAFFEIGCGHGAVIKQFEESLKVTVDGCDLNLHALNQIKGVKGRIFCLDIFNKPKALLNNYDAILLLDVIEHIDDDIHFLKNSLAYVKAGGLVIINVPALNILFSKYDIAAGHKRRYDKKMMKKLFATCDLEEISISYWGMSLIPIAIIRKIMLLFVSEKNIISAGFKTPNTLSNRVLNWILQTENKILNSPPLGTSLIGIGRTKKH